MEYFRLKRQYFVWFYEKFGEDLKKGQPSFGLWSKVWVLGFPPRFLVFIWRVVHGILAVKDVLRRRAIDFKLECLLCGYAPETVEHMFFHCCFSERLWRASSLG